MEIVRPAVLLDSAAVLRVIAEIDGDGSLALDPEHVITLGLPQSFVWRLAETIRAEELAVQFIPMAGPDARLASVWSLALLRAIAAHYGLTPPVSYVGHGRNASVLSEIITAHVEQREPRAKVWT